MSACSLVLDWNGYTGGVDSSLPDGERVPGDATLASDADDATQDAAVVGTSDAPSSTVDAPNAQEVGDVMDAGSPDSEPMVPPCTDASCGGCCTTVASRSFCAGGQAQDNCGANASQ